MRLTWIVALFVAALVTTSQAAAGSITFRDRIAAGDSRSVALATPTGVSFEVVLRAPALGRTQLLLLGAKAPRGGPLIDTRSYRCPRSGAARVCKARYEALPAGSYTWRVKRVSGAAGPVSLTVRW
ncbi:MAG: hypothetical protein R6W48_06490 [Gaiellaceae bacterium]